MGNLIKIYKLNFYLFFMNEIKENQNLESILSEEIEQAKYSLDGENFSIYLKYLSCPRSEISKIISFFEKKLKFDKVFKVKLDKIQLGHDLFIYKMNEDIKNYKRVLVFFDGFEEHLNYLKEVGNNESYLRLFGHGYDQTIGYVIDREKNAGKKFLFLTYIGDGKDKLPLVAASSSQFSQGIIKV